LHTPTIDLAFNATNNTFHGGWLALEPITPLFSRAGQDKWVFENNLFDKTVFAQDATQPIIYDYNAYWPCTGSELAQAQQGILTSPSGSGNGANELRSPGLPAAPSYQTGPFGDYYLNPNGSDALDLTDKGCDYAKNLGFYHYTTRPDQAKELNSKIDVGLHYIATSGSTSAEPKDADGDGLPDYIENWRGDGATGVDRHSDETDWNNPTSDSDSTTTPPTPIPDANSLLYGNSDLGGVGISGSVASALLLDPRSPSNPLTLKQVMTGGEPDVVTFEVPIRYSQIGDSGKIQLLVDGVCPTALDVEQAQDGTSCLVAWNMDYTSWNDLSALYWGPTPPANGPPIFPSGLHFIQAQFVADAKFATVAQQSDQPDQNILSATGPVILFNANNFVKFEPFFGSFDGSGATLYATLPTQSATYTITVADDSGNTITQLNGSTTSGEIAETWSPNPSYSGDGLTATFVVSQPSLSQFGAPTQQTAKQKLPRVVNPVCDGYFLVGYADSGTHRQDFEWLVNERGVVDYLMQTATENSATMANPYFSTLNSPDYWGTQPGGNPGWLSSKADSSDFLNQIGTQIVRNVFWDGHSTQMNLTDGADPPGVSITGTDLFDALHNKFNGSWVSRNHPYRFVFLNSCDSASDFGFCTMFGIQSSIKSDWLSIVGHQNDAQAFVGWVHKPKMPGSPNSPDWSAYWDTLGTFFYRWRTGLTLTNCLAGASRANPSLKFPLDLQYTPDELKPKNYGPLANSFHLVIWGYPGITRTAYIQGLDPR